VFCSTTRLRRLAARVLLLWLLTLGAGIVHACLMAPVQARMAAEPASSGHHDAAAADGAAPGAAPSHHGCCPDATDGDGAGLPDTSCAKLCADEAHSVPAPQHDFDASSALALAVLPTMALAEARSSAPAEAWQPGGAPPTARSGVVRIAFVRLTL
jgi:hypothetical protein